MPNKRKLVADVQRYFSLQNDLMDTFRMDNPEPVTVKDSTRMQWSIRGRRLKIGQMEASVIEGPHRGQQMVATVIRQEMGRVVAVLTDPRKEVPW